MSLPTPLAGLKVLELAGLAPSPFAGLILGDFGADIVRVDRLVTPFGPPRDTLCRHKRSVVIDLKSKSSRAVFLELVKVSDVIIDPYRPGVMDRLGLSYETLSRLNPRLIYAHLNGFRPNGMYGPRAGHDINYLAAAGILSLLGRKDEKPSPPANILGDFAGGGLICVTGILFALIHRQVSGKGQVVGANMVDGSGYLATFPRQHVGHQNWDRVRGDNLLDGAAPFYEVYETKDGRFMAVGAQEPQFYALFISGLHLGSIIDCSLQWDRTLWPYTKSIIAQRFKNKTLVEWRAIFDRSDACVTPVLSMSEIETPLAPMVDLSCSPSRDVSKQDDYPVLEKGSRCEEVFKEWLPELADKRLIEIDTVTRLATLQGKTKEGMSRL